MRYHPADTAMRRWPMRRADTTETGGARAGPLSDLVGLCLLGAGAYAAHAWLADSPYGLELGHRPLVTALLAAALAVDWSQGVKVMLVLGSSLSVMRTAAQRPKWAFELPSLLTPAPTSWRLEAAR
jgi:hypothetical protein